MSDRLLYYALVSSVVLCLPLSSGVNGSGILRGQPIVHISPLPTGCEGGCLLQILEPRSGWLVKRADHLVWRTNNGGISWQELRTPATMKDRAPNVRFVNRKAGLIVGQKQMYETTNGGLRWKSTELPAFDGLVQTTWFVPALHLAWIGGGTYVPADSGDGPNWTIKKYESGKWGILQPVVYFKNTTGPWIRSEVPSCDHSIIGLRFWDELRGVAVGDSCFYYTDTGGRRWETGVFHRGAEAISLFPYEGDEAPAFKPATFSWLDRNYGWASFDETLLYGTRDGGKNWSRIRSNAPYFECLVYYGPKFGIGIARGKLYQSSDSGITWNIIKTEFIPRSVYCSGKTACWVLSDTELYGLRVG